MDLASDPARTGVCVACWEGSAVVLETLEFGADDNALDAFICSLIARAAALGLTEPPPPAAPEPCTEGWIHLPSATPDEILRGRG